MQSTFVVYDVHMPLSVSNVTTLFSPQDHLKVKEVGVYDEEQPELSKLIIPTSLKFNVSYLF